MARFRGIMKKFLTITTILIILSVLGIFGYKAYKSDFTIPNYDKVVTLEYGSDAEIDIGNVYYGNMFKRTKCNVLLNTEINTDELKEYDVKYFIDCAHHTKEIDGKVSVVDTTGPTISTEVKEVKVCPNGTITPFDITAEDIHDGDVTESIEKEYKDGKVIVKAHDKSNNTSTIELDADDEDKTPPVITLKGKKSMSVQVGKTYTEPGATATDNCDKVDVKISGEVDTSKIGKYTITYTATDSSKNTSKQERVVSVYKPTSGSKVIYLTFDDGPSVYTSKLLDVLKKYDVKATFFVTKNGSDALIKREFDEGHTVALHTYSHNYKTLYTSVDGFFDDLYKVQNRVKRITGVAPTLMRFAGGSSNTISKNYDGGQHIMSKLVKEVENRGFTYFDWNVSSGDAGSTTSTDKVYRNVVNSLKSGSSVVLQHDIKGFSVNAVESIIKYGLENGYTFKPLTENSPTAHHGVLN